jgi:3-hydroxybutyryl-CoA dehydrogenase
MDINEIHTIGVVGCGLMGSGIVDICSRSGFNVIVREVDDLILAKGLDAVHASQMKAVDKGKLSLEDYMKAGERIRGTISFEDLVECDLVIEAAAENKEIKQAIFKQLDAICRPETILATNTSSLSITEIASVTRRPEKVIGMHFFNPVPVMPLLELVSGLLSSAETIQLTRGLGEKLTKSVVIVKDRPGFIVNLLLIPYLLDAIRWLDAGLASKEDLDSAIKLGLNHPMGPLTLSDLIGLDTILFVADALYEEFRDPRYVAPVLLRRMVKARLIGRKAGHGFYDYPA